MNEKHRGIKRPLKSWSHKWKNKRNHAKEQNTQGRSTQAIPLLSIGSDMHQWTSGNPIILPNSRGSEIDLNPSTGTLGITSSPAGQANGYSTFVVLSERPCRRCNLLDLAIPSSKMEAIDATFHVCLLACSLVNSSRSMRPIFGNACVYECLWRSWGKEDKGEASGIKGTLVMVVQG